MKTQIEGVKDRIEVLTCTAEVYIASKEKRPSDYIFKGVRCSDDTNVYNVLLTDASNLGAEVITDLRSTNRILYATAIIPKSHVLG
mgnify:CR=1 FL=1